MGGEAMGLGGAYGTLLCGDDVLPNDDDLPLDEDDLPPPLGILYLMIFKIIISIVHC